MIIKVCGLTDNQLTRQISSIRGISMVGFNFYPPSPRFVDYTKIEAIPNSEVKKVGVFVNEDISRVKAIVETLSLKYVQLHSLEDQNYIDQCIEFCEVIKAVGVEDKDDIAKASKIKGCSFLLFDKKSKEHGGTGLKFDWQLINEYHGDTPFLLAGGIGPDDVRELRALRHPKFAGIDINSRFEDSPGIKNVKLISQFLENLEL